MTKSEHCVLLANLVEEVNEKVLNNDDMQLNCFVLTRFFIRL